MLRFGKIPLIAIFATIGLLALSSANASAPPPAKSPGESALPTPETVLAVYQEEAAREVESFRQEVSQISKTRQELLDRIESVRALIVGGPDGGEGTTKKSVFLLRLWQETKTLKKQLSNQVRLFKRMRTRAAERAVAHAYDELDRLEAVRIDTDAQHARHREEALKLLRRQKRETLASLDAAWKADFRQARDRIETSVKQLNEAMLAEEKRERGPIVGYKLMPHRGHVHREPVYQNQKTRK